MAVTVGDSRDHQVPGLERSGLAGGCGDDDGGDDDGGDDDGGDDDTAPTERLQPDDLVYEGAFRLPSDFDYGARGLAYRPDGDGGAGSLLATGFEADPAWFGEVEIPVPVITTNWQALPMATMLQPMAEFDGDLVETTLDGHTTAPSGIEWVAARGSQGSDKLYGSVDWWYAVSGGTFPTVWMSELDGSNPRGHRRHGLRRRRRPGVHGREGVRRELGGGPRLDRRRGPVSTSGFTGHTLGIWAIFVQMLPFAALHVRKPPTEALLSIVGGVILAAVVWRCRSFWVCIPLHHSQMFAMNLFCALRERTGVRGVGLGEFVEALKGFGGG